MEKTGIFTETMKQFFEAEQGAYTSITAVELKKSTFNVKKVIRKLLIERMGRENIPDVNQPLGPQTIRFRICAKAKIYGNREMDIPCKFSKRNKDEMTIYFNREMLNSMNAEEGDIWYIYFKHGQDMPVLGVMTCVKWENLFSDEGDFANPEPDEKSGHILEYTVKAGEMTFEEIEAPEKRLVQRFEGSSIVKSMSAEEAGRREKNRKNKGNHGEEIAIEIEKRRLEAMGRKDLISKITHVAKFRDGLGYDIISTDVDASGVEKEIYIEVKATAGDITMPFYVSFRELEVSRRYRELYYVYRIFNMGENKKSVQFYRINGALDESFNLFPANYIAY